QLLLAVGEELVESELAALKFLSLEYIPLRKLEAIQNAQDFFEALQEVGVIEGGNLSFLKELLYRISRIDLLVAHLGSNREEMERELKIPGRSRVYLLFQLSEDVTKNELNDFKFLLGKELPKCRQSPETMMLDVFIDMEKKGILGEDNLRILKSCCAKINLSLLKRIEEYELNLFGKTNSSDSYKEYSQVSGTSLCCATSRGWEEQQSSLSNILSFQELEAYKMSSQPRGVCLILNNHNFAKAREAIPALRDLKDRRGTNMDAAALRRVFSKLHFAVAEHKDLTAEAMRKTLNKYRSEDHKDCFVCCILSHGKKGSVYGVDGQAVPIRELTASFTGQNCRSLAGKPKVFFIQACQGGSSQKGVAIERDSVEQDSSVETDGRVQYDYIPEEADFLLGMATLQDCLSYRSPSEGSWYIQALCQHLEYRCPRGEDILTILTAVNEEVSKKAFIENAQQQIPEKQMPQPSFTLRKKLIFPVN
ncbi:CASP8 protein, partial [Eubucco bourcierii]|nr:CASP8 protein [Eubucco bourcierii]